MNVHNLPSIVKRGRKRLGLGHGSGRGKTGGRGTKGQNARGKRPLFFEGGAVPLTKRLPFLRGKNRNKSFSDKPFILNLDVLAKIPLNKVINIDTLISFRLVSVLAKKHGVKLLGNGTVKKAYTVQIPATKSAIEKITQAGGSVEQL
jgi:large subunit ribosomal protein L15